MSEQCAFDSEQNLEKRQAIMAAALLCVAIALGSSALRLLVDADSSGYAIISWLRAGGGIGGALIFVYSIAVAALHLRSIQPAKILEGFIRHAFYKATAIAWTTALVALSLMNEFIDGGSALPPDFYTKTATAILLASFSISYFYITRIDSDEE